jgi:hypothetical protein
MPDAMTAAAAAKNKERWTAFVDALARRLEGGERVETRVLREIAARQAQT